MGSSTMGKGQMPVGQKANLIPWHTGKAGQNKAGGKQSLGKAGQSPAQFFGMYSMQS